MPVTNWKSPTANGTIFADWSNAQNMYSSNNLYALTPDKALAAHGFTGFKFDDAGDDGVPSTATITGVEWKVEGKVLAAGDIIDIAGRIIKAGALSGVTAPAPPLRFTLTADRTLTYGGDGYMMENTLSGSDARLTNFGIMLYAARVASDDRFRGDWLAMRLHYIDAIPVSFSLTDVVSVLGAMTPNVYNSTASPGTFPGREKVIPRTACRPRTMVTQGCAERVIATVSTTGKTIASHAATEKSVVSVLHTAKTIVSYTNTEKVIQ